MTKAILNTTTSRTGYIGMERDSELGLAEHGVRKYDDEIGRFTAPDALWEKYVGWSPYQYSLNNPVMFQDGNGYDIEYQINGQTVALVETEEKKVYNYDNDQIKIDPELQPFVISVDNLVQMIEDDPEMIAYGFSVEGEFTFFAGGNTTIQFINFLEGEDKDNGTFIYAGGSGRLGANISLSAQMIKGYSDAVDLNRNTPAGNFLDFSIGIGPLSYSISKGVYNNEYNNVFKNNVFTTQTVGLSMGGQFDGSFGIGATKLIGNIKTKGK